MFTKKRVIWLVISILLIVFIWSYFGRRNDYEKKEQLSAVESFEQSDDSSSYQVPLRNHSTFNQLNTTPNSVLLTGIDEIRLIPIYKLRQETDRNINFNNSSYSGDENIYTYFMPGIDIINGYNLVNMGYYDLKTEKLSYIFQKPVLIKTFYYPSLEQDSLDNKPISRDYFMVSVYDEDTNKDSLINNKDLRKFYHIARLNLKRTQILSNGYSSVRSTYDYKNDIMYIYAREDKNKNGTPDKDEPINIFWLRLKDPTVLRKMY
jgi:hypothetical protein